MKIKIFFLILSIFAQLFTGCEKDEFFIEPLDNATLKSAQSKMVYVPFKGDLKIWIKEGSVVEDGPDRTQVMLGTGNLTHLGKTTFCANENVSMATWTGVEEVTFTAANGDKLDAHLTNVINPAGYPLLLIEGEGFFTGGTGRFKNAEGTLHYHATFHVENNKGEKYFTGKIKW